MCYRILLHAPWPSSSKLVALLGGPYVTIRQAVPSQSVVAFEVAHPITRTSSGDSVPKLYACLQDERKNRCSTRLLLPTKCQSQY